MRARILVVVGIILATIPGRADAKSYSADRFDSRVEVLRGGSLRVAETVVFRFEGGAFTQVFRQIPSRNTDGLEIERVAMDGVPFSEGDGAGRFQLTNKDGPRVTWRFAPVSDSAHTFEITYLVRGVVWQDAGADVVAWNALPTEHEYSIASSSFDFELPSPPIATPSIDVRRGGPAAVALEDTHVRIRVPSLRSNGRAKVTIRLPRGSVIDAPPQWQQRQAHATAMAPTWIATAGLVLGAGLVVLFAIRQGYDAPPPGSASASRGPARPDSLPPALAGALVSNGRPTIEHAMAALFSLADRGELQISEEPRSFMQHVFAIVRTPSGRPLAEHEQAVMDIAFTGKQLEQAATLTKVRGRISRRLRRFSAAVRHELADAGLLDQGRQAVRNRYRAVVIAAMVLGAASPVSMAVLADQYGAWPLLVSGAFFLVGVTALIAWARHTPLSNDGVRRAREWRGFQQYLKDLVRDRSVAPTGVAGSLLPFAVAVGLAAGWSKFMKLHRSEVPAWFRAIDVTDQGHAFATMIAVGGAQAGHGGGAGAGGAAGGGASGAH